MKKINIIVVIILIGIIRSFGQDMERRINLVISIDGNMVRSIINASILIDNNQHIELGYIPGELILNNDDFEKFINSNSHDLIFDYYEYAGKKQLLHHYEIELKKVWFEQSYIVLRIYNMDKKKNKKIFYPLQGKEYTYEIDLPSNSITRIKKK